MLCFRVCWWIYSRSSSSGLSGWTVSLIYTTLNHHLITDKYHNRMRDRYALTWKIMSPWVCFLFCLQGTSFRQSLSDWINHIFSLTSGWGVHISSFIYRGSTIQSSLTTCMSQPLWFIDLTTVEYKCIILQYISWSIASICTFLHAPDQIQNLNGRF